MSAQELEAATIDKYEPHIYQNLSYRLMKPNELNPTKTYPLILSLHGAGGRGTDNIKQLRKWNEYLAKDEIRA